jgi:hypothetical protein
MQTAFRDADGLDELLERHLEWALVVDETEDFGEPSGPLDGCRHDAPFRVTGNP